MGQATLFLQPGGQVQGPHVVTAPAQGVEDLLPGHPLDPGVAGLAVLRQGGGLLQERQLLVFEVDGEDLRPDRPQGLGGQPPALLGQPHHPRPHASRLDQPQPVQVHHGIAEGGELRRLINAGKEGSDGPPSRPSTCSWATPISRACASARVSSPAACRTRWTQSTYLTGSGCNVVFAFLNTPDRHPGGLRADGSLPGPSPDPARAQRAQSDPYRS